MLMGLVAVLLVPAVWSTAAAATTQNGTMPAAGPATRGMPGGGMPGGMAMPGMPSGPNPMPGMGFPGAGMSGGGELTQDQRRILDYAARNSDGAAITLAVNAPAMMAASYVIGSDETVIGMGGFGGADDAPSVDQLARWSADGTLRFVTSSSGGGFMSQGGGHTQQRHEWIDQHCEKVDPSAYNGSAAGVMGASTLYDCRS